ncbi:hypothetical protein BD626DRAFT_545952 [Schizophyllum amplum]|uniref:CRIB domain-containing protein n=1 Tax=Schizophyllum amplum TaxID=97359 RepID=A0A550CQ45_9AGAR|nr:hypothetical protein BD626DRAFT_545952 [Auriculariopsis ampla]
MFSQLFSATRSTDQLTRPTDVLPFRATANASPSTAASTHSSTETTASHTASIVTSSTSHQAATHTSTSPAARAATHPVAFTPLATASARVYHADFGARNAKTWPARRGSVSGAKKSGGWSSDGRDGWAYSGLAGTLVFGCEAREAAVDPRRSGTVDPTSGAIDSRSSTPQFDVAAVDSARILAYSFRLADETGRPIWTFKIPTGGFDYSLDRPFFHVFAGKSRRFGLRFDDDGLAEEFARIVRARTSITGNRDRSRTFPGAARPFSRAFASASRGSLDGPPSLDGAIASSPVADLRPSHDATKGAAHAASSNAGRPAANEQRPPVPERAVPSIPSSTATSPPSDACNPTSARPMARASSRKMRRVRVSMISRPAPGSFVHVGHVGIGKHGGIEVSQGMDPLWTTLLADCRCARARSVVGKRRRGSQSSASVLSQSGASMQSRGSMASVGGAGSGRSTPAYGVPHGAHYPGRQSPVHQAPGAATNGAMRVPYYRRGSSDTTSSRALSL